MLRRQFSAGIKRANIYLPACGCGVMFQQVWRDKADHVLALDVLEEKIRHFKYHHPTVDARVANINTFSDWPEHVKFSIADFDVYGSPYTAILNFLNARIWASPLYIIVTDGVPSRLGRGGFLPTELTGERESVRVLDSEARRHYFDGIVRPWWMTITASIGLTLREHIVLWKRGKRVVYYAFKLTY